MSAILEDYQIRNFLSVAGFIDSFEVDSIINECMSIFGEDLKIEMILLVALKKTREKLTILESQTVTLSDQTKWIRKLNGH